ncbi:hypothetical protein [Clostridium psychrophilum]|nr:hypothetical protein [Clostridium psychrophilum]
MEVTCPVVDTKWSHTDIDVEREYYGDIRHTEFNIDVYVEV